MVTDAAASRLRCPSRLDPSAGGTLGGAAGRAKFTVFGPVVFPSQVDVTVGETTVVSRVEPTRSRGAFVSMSLGDGLVGVGLGVLLPMTFLADDGAIRSAGFPATTIGIPAGVVVGAVGNVLWATGDRQGPFYEVERGAVPRVGIAPREGGMAASESWDF